ncbi:undecaprenyl-diphosphate phosphatase [Deinococcus deserti]|uniref:Undecaprenyl-diphosphatase n=1 Tax=Deinococcus deserti (strain DSM 17065 / CIP 109153 / LMG 22923 / VCD115) TaxID=546414 RepID=UPPP_DEIDV|nr:undecaprenyl-diphosphate phosphatase [Deinococcus deserti]C1CVN6.1 RecName: Full=Undecaprenyl-diphosphatase; AltName: Full=Bacitracin resistance protein; AltName: Full=Undecaprenyl pyrophosphate phosphatase [Deinococcus deserti VCD115]ACO46253.1 putative Undecaprenyl-diphosphatase (Undecaprenyl pyrophosphate phosphatase) (Bacitracin resistance protein) [Deinococcus deserti VCD115]
MDWVYAIVYGIVEGITEFLPISSTGHLILTGNLMGVPWSKEVKDAFEVVIQGGAILSVLVYYWRDFLKIRHLGHDRSQQTLWTGVLVATIPAVVLGLAFGDQIQAVLFKPSVVAWALIVGGVLMWLIESRRVQPQVHAIETIGVRRSLLIGVLQCLALVWPGFSRSASSILGGMALGLDRPTATKFSFYLGVPTLGGAALLNLVKERELIFGEIGLLNVVLGAGVSFVVAYLAIGWLLKFVSTNNFKGFAVYRVAVGVLILVLIATGVMSNGSLA